MAKSKIARAAGDTVATTAREEMVLLLFRELTPYQQRELLDELQAMREANEVARKAIKGKKLRTASNEDVRAAFKDVPRPAAVAVKKPGTRGRPPEAAGDDFEPPLGR